MSVHIAGQSNKAKITEKQEKIQTNFGSKLKKFFPYQNKRKNEISSQLLDHTAYNSVKYLSVLPKLTWFQPNYSFQDQKPEHIRKQKRKMLLNNILS